MRLAKTITPSIHDAKFRALIKQREQLAFQQHAVSRRSRDRKLEGGHRSLCVRAAVGQGDLPIQGRRCATSSRHIHVHRDLRDVSRTEADRHGHRDERGQRRERDPLCRQGDVSECGFVVDEPVRRSDRGSVGPDAQLNLSYCVR